ncbi:serine/threonine-protein kinase like [Verticillium longisporum]|nr:serine/threonine-protein kinase like [Verticillium longisporum]
MVFQLLLTNLASSVSPSHRLVLRLLRRDPAVVEQHDTPEAFRPNPPPCIRYRPIPGSWERKLHPHWPDHVFRMPQQPEEGDIYYVTKGDCVRMRRTAFVELLPSGHVSKTPKLNPYCPEKEKENRQCMEREALIYHMVGASSFIPELIAWDPASCTLTLRNYPNGDPEMYIRKPDYKCRVSLDVRLRWVLHAAESLAVVHAIGVTHNYIAPRNFLLDEDLNLRICDFAGSSLPNGSFSGCAPGPRYEPRPWSRDYVATQADDIFALGSVMYFIVTGEEPYSNLDDEEVERRFQNRDFPASSHLCCGTVIQNCWLGHFVAAKQVVQALVCEV